MKADTVIVGGRIVTDGWSGDGSVVIGDGRVLAVLDPSVDIDPQRAARVIDASGKLVMPGGVDPHCHLAIPLGAFVTLDSFASASAAALAGGTTTIIDFAIPVPGEDPVAGLDKKLDMAHESHCDYAFHGCLGSRPDDVQGVIDAFAERGVRTVKLFTTYRGELMVDLETIEAVMVALKGVDGLTYIHAEENTAIEAAQQEAATAGRIDARHMAGSRPAEAEEDAVVQVLGVAERVDAPVYFVHQSIPSAVGLVWEARRRGVRAFSETCPHYLTLDDSCYDGDGPERFVCCPPIRGTGTVAALVGLASQGLIHTVGSDHCCYSAVQKHECAHDVRLMPNGLPGVETRLPVTWSALVKDGGLSLEGFVALVSANPARLNGLYPRKGTIAPGSDADIVIFDPEESRVVTVSDLHMETDYTPYEGRTVTGWPTLVMLRGRVVVEGGALVGPGSQGELVRAEAIHER
ncbi:MAG: dihydropyrimidinase [Candidatus Nanopelagicales bacterium]